MIHKKIQELAQLRLTENTWSVNLRFTTPSSSNRSTREILIAISGKKYPSIISGTVTNFAVDPVELAPVPVFDPYYPNLNPNPLSGIL